jgi:glycosyltransferase involved in cell wall biosynthesis
MSDGPRRAVVVLGMHRSGTSALARLLVLAGATPPGDLMPPNDDNPRGYWESRQIARFNNRLLESAGTRWNDDAGIPADWFEAAARRDDRAEAMAILKEEYGSAAHLVLKDPRICRLLPFWREVFAAAGIVPYGLVVVRDPVAVACSLAARAHVPQFRPASIPALSRGLLLWLRYVLDAERHARELPHCIVQYADVISDWRQALARLFVSDVLSEPGSAAADEIDAFLDPALQRQRSMELVPADVVPEAVELLRRLAAGLHEESGEAREFRDQITTRLAQLQAGSEAVRRGHDPLADRDPGAERILAGLVKGAASHPRPRQSRSVLFLSAAPRSIGHVYRVKHAAAAITEAGWQTEILPLDAAMAASQAHAADMVVVFRGRWSKPFAAIRGTCADRGIPLVYDVDDLLFDPAVTAAGCIAFLDGLPPVERDRWIAEAADYRRAIEESDAAVLTTPSLAAAARPLCGRCFVLPNALDRGMETAAAAALARPKRSAADGRRRLVFASGTPTHHRDFAVAARATARIMACRPEVVLVIIGHLDPTIFPDLAPFSDRIERQPPVPLDRLFEELVACDVNLCPLELGNPFCEAKSAVRWLAAAAVGVPSVVSPTAPLQAVVIDGVTGLIATDATAWEMAIGRLLDEPALTASLGEASRIDALARFGFDAWAPQAVQIYASIADEFAASLPGVFRP